MIEVSVPTPEQLTATYDGIDFESFIQLSAEEVTGLGEALQAELRSTRSREVHPDGNSHFTDEYWALLQRRSILSNFITWRRFGIPDREISYQDVEDYAVDLLEARRAVDPNHGDIPESHYDDWTDEEFDAVDAILQYCYQMRGLTEQPVIDTYSLHAIIGLSRPLLSRMVELGALDPLGGDQSYIGPDQQIYHQYYLTKPYLDNVISVVTNWAKEDRNK